MKVFVGVAFVYCSNLSKSHRRSTVATAEKEKEQKRLLNPPKFFWQEAG